MTLQLDELVFGYWPARQLRGEIPSPIRSPDEYDGGTTLSIACTQTGLPRAQQEKLIDAWCSQLPTLTSLKTLDLCSKVPQRLFDAACAVPQLDALSIKWSSITSLDALRQARALRALYLGSSPGVRSLEPASKLVGLRHLFFENVQQPADLSWVEGLVELKEIGIAAARGRRMQVCSLQPLAFLKRLEMLWLVDLRILQGGLAPLHSLSAN